MNTLCLRRLLLVLLIALPATSPALRATEGAVEIKEFSDLIHDLHRFAAKLPTTVLISASAEEVARPEFNRALARLKRLHTVELFAFPADQSPARPLNILPPVYPAELREQNITGEAFLIGLIGPEGTVEAIYVAGATRKEFAISAAIAYGRWEFQPAMVNNEQVPVLVVQTLVFKSVPPAEVE